MRNKPPAWLYKRTRLLNIFHAMHLASAHSQMTDEEMDCLQKHAKAKMLALEIGTYMGVTAAIIASAMADKGSLYCIDPFESKASRQNPGFQIAVRELKRQQSFQKVNFLLGFSNDKEIIRQVPAQLDLILVDGDHSYEGLANDWEIVTSKLAADGIVCLHDTTIPAAEPYRDFGSVKFFNEVVAGDKRFTLIETVYSMNVLMKND